MDTSRIETLSDGIFAIAMTLLILNIQISPDHLAQPQFLDMLRALVPNILAYIVSFMVLAVYWIGHHNQFAWIERTNRPFLWLNIFFLMSIAFLPFSTSLLSHYPDMLMAISIYAANVIISGILLYTHWNYARRVGLVKSTIPPNVSKILGQRILLGIFFYFLAIIIAFFSHTISLAMFAILPFVYMIPSQTDAMTDAL